MAIAEADEIKSITSNNRTPKNQVSVNFCFINIKKYQQKISTKH